MTNNPLKISALESEGIRVSARVPLEGEVNPDNESYLLTKAQRMDHLLRLTPVSYAAILREPYDCQPAD
jgi:hypothetical protein